MTTKSIGAFWLAAAIASAAGCSGSSPPTDECQSACQRVLSCAPAGYGYRFNFTYAYSFGYGRSYGYGAPDLQQCLSDCAALPQTPRDRIAQCVVAAADCTVALQCN